jgi:hypothetical protein
VLAAIRPTGWDFPLFLHVLGAMILVGGLVVAVGMQLFGWRRRDPADAAAFSRGSLLGAPDRGAARLDPHAHRRRVDPLEGRL